MLIHYFISCLVMLAVISFEKSFSCATLSYSYTVSRLGLNLAGYICYEFVRLREPLVGALKTNSNQHLSKMGNLGFGMVMIGCNEF